jgi:hypothetical protein
MTAPLDEHHAASLRHILVIWTVLLGVLVGAFALTVLALNTTVFSASGFVSSYLGALERHDLEAALATPGVLGAVNVSSELLTPDALGELEDVAIAEDTDQGGGIHLVTYTAGLDGTSVRGSFQVQHTGTRLGVFSTWAFIQSPMSILRVTPMHDASFTVNGVDVTSEAGPSLPSAYQVLAPGVFTLGHESAYLAASPVTAVVSDPGSIVPVSVDIRATTEFVSAMQKQVDDFLDACTTQEVLFPTGCPFGQELANRVESTPKWSMTRYPEITVEPGSDPGTWVVPETQGAAHLVVEVRSLFDGTLSTFDEDVQFSLSWTMTVDGDHVAIRQQN